MGNYATLKAAIQNVVKTNGNNEITGSLLQQSLLAMIESLGAGYQYMGIATPATNPGTPDQNVFYLASTAGIYTNFGSLSLAENEVAILKYNGTWTKDASGWASANVVDKLAESVGDTSLLNEYKTLSPTIKTGYYRQFSNNTEVQNSSYEYATVPVSVGQKYLLTGWNINNNIPLAWVYNSVTGVKARAITQSASAAMSDQAYTIPDGYDTLYVNGRPGYSSVVVKKLMSLTELTVDLASRTTTNEQAINVLQQLANDGYKYMGVAVPTTNPGTPEQNVFYLAITPGEYTNFGLTLKDATIGIFRYDGTTWAMDEIRSFAVAPTNTIAPAIAELYISNFVEGMTINTMAWDGSTISFTIRMGGDVVAFLSARAATPGVPIYFESVAASPVQCFIILTLTSNTVSWSSTNGVVISNNCGNLFLKPVTTKKLIDLVSSEITESENVAVERSAEICVSRLDRGSLNPNGLYNNSYIYLCRRFNADYDAVLCFGNKDAAAITNKFFDFRSFSILTRGQENINYPETVVDGTEIIGASTTDSISPLIVGAVNNIDGDNTEKWFTGGNHAYGNVGNGVSRTMRELSCDVLVDGKVVQIGNKGIRGNHAIIKVVNRIQGYNTCKQDGSGREIVEQRITVDFTHTKCVVTVEYIALEQIIIYDIAGVAQYCAANSSRKYRFIGSTSKKGLYEFNSTGNVPDNTDRKINPIQILYNGYCLGIRMSDIGLGNLAYNPTMQNAYETAANKVYTRLFDTNQAVQLDANDKLEFQFEYETDFNVV